MKKVLVLSLVGLVILGWWVINFDNRGFLVICDVGQGQAVMWQKGMTQILMDTGADNQKVLRCLEKTMPFWDKKIEAVMISHWDNDHSGGLTSVLKYYKVGRVWSNTPAGEKADVEVEELSRDDVIRIGEMSIRVWWPAVIRGNSNDDSLVLSLEYRGYWGLIMGDISKTVEEELLYKYGTKARPEVMVVSHHGSGEATSREWLKSVTPQLAVISVGKNNKFGHPAKLVIDNLEELGIKVMRTDEDRTMRIRWD